MRLNHTTFHVLSFVKHAVGIITSPTSWAKPRGSKCPEVSKVVSVSIILMTLSLSTPTVCVTVSRSDTVESVAALRCKGLQMNRDSPAGKGTRFLYSPEPPVIRMPVSRASRQSSDCQSPQPPDSHQTASLPAVGYRESLCYR